MGRICSMPRGRELLLDCDEPKKLVQCRWRIINPTFYMIYRMVLIVYTLIMWIFALTFHPKFIFIYLTTWGYSVLTLSFLIKGFAVSRYFHWTKIEETTTCTPENDENIPLIGRLPSDEVQGNDNFSLSTYDERNRNRNRNVESHVELPWLLQFSWLLNNIATTIGIMISIIFWSAIFPVIHDSANMGTIQLHGINSLLLLIDLCIVAVPFRMCHIYQPITFGLAYISFNAIYWAAGGLDPFGRRPIYPITNWDKPVHLMFTILGALILIIIIHGLLVLLTKGLDHIAKRKLTSETNTAVPVSVVSN